MPYIWTHQLFGQEIITELGHSAILTDTHLKKVFQLGCQGPDFLFYHNFLPWKNNKVMNHLGNLIHSRECGPFLIDLIDEVKGRGLYNPAVVYVLGFCLHHLLDRTMHPYIFYHSGFKKWHHQRLEIILDTLIMKRQKNIDTWNTPVWKEIYIGNRLPSGISFALMKLTQKYFPEQASHINEQYWHDSYLDMIRALRIFHDPYGIKRIVLAGSIDPFVYKRKLEPLDFLNESHRTWNCPTDQNEVYSRSVWDLWEIAKEDSTSVMYEVIRYIFSTPKAEEASQRDKVIQILGNQSYETGKDCDLNLQITFVNPMF